jgi:hypothetical protein
MTQRDKSLDSELYLGFLFRNKISLVFRVKFRVKIRVVRWAKIPGKYKFGPRYQVKIN